MYKFYTKYDVDYVANVFEFMPSASLLPVISQKNDNKPLVSIRDSIMESKGYHRLASINLDINLDKSQSKTFKLAYKNGDLIIGEREAFFKDEEVDWAVDLSYSLLINGRINTKGSNGFKHYGYRHPRTLIGKKRDGTVVLCVVDGKSQKARGVTATRSAEIMLSLGCTEAINADGAGSSQLMYRDKIINEYPGFYARPVSSALIVYDKIPLKKEEPEDYPMLRLWAKGDYVVILQKALEMLDCNPGRIDGIFDPAVLAAVKQFQKKYKMVVTGTVDKAMWKLLLRI